MIRRFRIAHMMPWCSVGGVELATFRIAKALERTEFEHIAFCYRDAQPVRSLFTDAGFSSVNYVVEEPSYRRPGPFMSASLALARLLREQRIDLVHCADLLAGHYTALAGRLSRLPVLCHIRNRFDEVSRRDCTFLRPVNRFAFVSQDTWRRFGCQVPPRRGTIVYDGLDIPEIDAAAVGSVRQELSIDPEHLIVGMAARVAPQKDYPTLIRAAGIIASRIPRVKFLVVGDNSSTAAYRQHFAEMQAQIAAAHLEEHFIFTGGRDDALRLIAAMDIFVLSTHQEGLPLVLIEAMAQGRPVVATGIDGIPEVVADGETGYLYPHEDHEQLARHVLALAADSNTARAFGAAGRERIRAKFSREQFAESMAALYRGMLER